MVWTSMATRRWREEAGFEMSIHEQLMDQVWEVRGKRNQGWPWGLDKASVWLSGHLLRQGRQREE